ncbi:uncharacterized protein LOC128223314 [Mya arenaria]|uniref:uncharacterized protein LOC128223314 n=1 Tax=Mya arenaria TaxID=6604 RepID=UPI0022E6D8C0|nr:uncharacterized protein LOC128223314 [Mya arenaria]
MEKNLKTPIYIGVGQDNGENRRRRENIVQGEVPGQMSSANHIAHAKNDSNATLNGEVSGRMPSANHNVHGSNTGAATTLGEVPGLMFSVSPIVHWRNNKKATMQGEVPGRMSSANHTVHGKNDSKATLNGEVPGRKPSANDIVQGRKHITSKGGVVSGTITSSDIERGPPSSDADKSSEVVLDTSSAQIGRSPSNTYKSSEVMIETSSAPCCQSLIKACGNVKTRGKVLSTFIGKSCSGLCSFKLLLQLCLPLCSLSIAIPSVVLPNWAWSETDKVAVGLFKCCNFTEENRTNCSPLSDCVPSDSNFFPLRKGAAALLITYIAFHGVTIFLATRSQQKHNDDTVNYHGWDAIISFCAAAVGYIGIFIFLLGFRETASINAFPPRMSMNLAIISCVIYQTYAAFLLKSRKPLTSVPIAVVVSYVVVYIMTVVR